MVQLLVLADTHVRAGGGPALPAMVFDLAARADLVFHAGDVVDGDLLDRLDAIAPTYAVLGNNDLGLIGRLPETLMQEIAGVRVAMVHDSGPREGRAGRLRRRFPDAHLVLFGHSHMPVDAEGASGQRLFNPGSPTQRRSAPHRTVGWLELGGGEIIRHEHVVVEG